MHASWDDKKISQLIKYQLSSFQEYCITIFICEALHKFDLFHCIDEWFQNSIFPTNTSWKLIVKRKIKDYEENSWLSFVSDHPNFQMARYGSANVSPEGFGLSQLNLLTCLDRYICWLLPNTSQYAKINTLDTDKYLDTKYEFVSSWLVHFLAPY